MARNRVGKRTSAMALGAAVTLAVAGCGVTTGTGTGPGSAASVVHVDAGSFSGRSGAQVLARSASSTAKVSSMRMSLTETMSGGSSDMAGFGVTASGEVDTAAKRMHLTENLSMGSVGSGSVEEIVDGTTIYMKSSLFSSLGGSDKPWVKTTFKGLASSRLGGSYDPTQFLQFLEGSGATVTTVGTESVRGVETTHVHAVVDLTKLIKKASPKQAKALTKALSILGGSSILTHMPIDAWVDHDGYVRKLTETMDMGAAFRDMNAKAKSKVTIPAEELDLKVVVTIEMYDFNEPVTITIPPASQVGSLPGTHH